MAKIIQAAERVPVTDNAKKHGVSEQALYMWRKRHGHLEAAVVNQMRSLQQETARPRMIQAGRDLGIEFIKEITARRR